MRHNSEQSICVPALEPLEQRLLLSSYYVDAALGNDNNAGTATSPLATIKKGVTKATKAGDTVIVRSGTYRENNISFPNSGTASAPITLKAEAGANVVVKGSLVVTGWSPVAGTTATYRHSGWTYSFGSWIQALIDDPNAVDEDGDRYDARSKARNQIFVDGQIVTEVSARQWMTPGTFYLDAANDQIDLWLADGSSPAGHTVEATNTAGPLLTTNNKSYLKIEGIGFEHCANAAQGNAAVRVTGGGRVTVDNIRVEWAAGAGFTVSSGSWFVIRNSKFNNNGQLGIHSSSAVDTLVEDCETSYNNTHPNKRYNDGWEAGGNKFSRTTRLTLNRHLAHDNMGSGIWFDIDNRNAVISNCVSYENKHGIHYEISYSATIFNNLMFNNRTQGSPDSSPVGIGIYISSSALCKVYNNTIWGNDTYGVHINSSIREDGSGHGITGSNNLVYNNIVSENEQTGSNTKSFLIAYGNNYDPVTYPDEPHRPPLPVLDNPDYTIDYNWSDYNLFWPKKPNDSFFIGPGSERPTNLADWQRLSNQDLHSAWGDPMFANKAGADFSLLTGSAAIDIGTALAEVGLDYDGVTRPKGLAYDVGAFEYALNFPIGWWRFNENSGSTLADSSGSSNPASQVGADWTSGVQGAGLSLDGSTSDRVVLPASVLDGKADVTVSLWLRTSRTGQQCLVSAANAARDNEFEVLLNGSTELRVYYHNLSLAWSGLADLANDAWHHIAVVLNDAANTIEPYIDGQSLGARSRNIDVLSVQSLVLGQEQDSVGGGFDAIQACQGTLDEVRAYAVALTATEIATLANPANLIQPVAAALPQDQDAPLGNWATDISPSQPAQPYDLLTERLEFQPAIRARGVLTLLATTMRRTPLTIETTRPSLLMHRKPWTPQRRLKLLDVDAVDVFTSIGMLPIGRP